MEIGNLIKVEYQQESNSTWQAVKPERYKKIFDFGLGIIIGKELSSKFFKDNYGDIFYYTILWLKNNQIGIVYNHEIKNKCVKVQMC
jgi:hypothetical protein